MTLWTRRLASLALFAALCVASAARALDEVNVSKGATQAGPGLAVRGYDVVAYFTTGRPTLGSDRYAVAHQGATYRFASQANLDAFEASPQKYLPAYGGFCAYGAAVSKKFDGDPLFWKIVAGRLFLNLNADVQQKWAEDEADNIAKADRNWRRIEQRPVGEL